MNINKNCGFTLIELLVVIVIIGILTSLTTALFGQYRIKSNIAKYQIQRNQAAKDAYDKCVSINESTAYLYKGACRTSFASVSLVDNQNIANNVSVDFTFTNSGDIQTAISHDGASMFYTHRYGPLYQKDACTDDAGTIVSGASDNIQSFDLTPDGEYLIYQAPVVGIRKLKISDLPFNAGDGESLTNGGGPRDVKITPDGNSIIYRNTHDSGRLWKKSASGVGAGERISPITGVLSPAVFSPDGEYIFYSAGWPNVSIYRKSAYDSKAGDVFVSGLGTFSGLWLNSGGDKLVYVRREGSRRRIYQKNIYNNTESDFGDMIADYAHGEEFPTQCYTFP